MLRLWHRRLCFVAPAGRAVAGVAGGLILCAAVVADVPPPSPEARDQRPARDERSDPRHSKLAGFFDRYHCAQPYPIAEYLRAADGYGLDYRLLPAVSIRETSCGKSNGPRNNLWGFHQQDFASIAEGIEFLAHRLTEHPYYKHKSLRDKLFTYNPRAAYPDEILRLMRQIE